MTETAEVSRETAGQIRARLGLRRPDTPGERWAAEPAEALEASALLLMTIVTTTGAERRAAWLASTRLGDMVLVSLAPRHAMHRVGRLRGRWALRGGESFLIETLDGRGVFYENVALMRADREGFTRPCPPGGVW